MPKSKSLRKAILQRLLVPLILFISCETVLSYYVTLHYVNETYDRWLLDSASSLAQEIKIRDAKVLVELSESALEIVRWDERDKTFFKIFSESKGLLAGDSFVPEPKADLDFAGPVFFSADIDREPVRVVVLRVQRADIQDTFYVHVAETLKKRHTMMMDILLADLIPQLAMVLFASGFLLSGLSRGLKPLKVLADEISKRSPHDLSLIADTNVVIEVKALTDTINGLLTQLSAAIEGQQRFVANAAHQLRTPLAGFSLQVERALREEHMADIKPALIQMRKSAERLSHTVNQLLVLARAEPVDGINHFQTLNLCELVRNNCMEWASKAAARQMELGFESARENISIEGDETLLGEMLNNLLDNAIAYGGPMGRIAVEVKPHPYPTVIIEDDGPGIPEQEIEKVFERFHRVPGSVGNGCGLGLAIVKEIANLHGIKLELSHVSQTSGTRVILTFPPATAVSGSGFSPVV
ncbi:sensor histidine kinase N-terminal domain-containing protein [Methylomonas sp. SURF-2]|uniref:histidine kinase n=1 Tax=Methylomonas subterranea TaxID=2952225 RepID=A0ABT1THE8_9GAMM|nr:sensor histidine kinase [Methylomonas sp. SURF-2]MCQ8104885.1 sensor histidine kinase N-terminal domain-containing protein [Methylomonas sp. SURF-2]